MSDYDVPGMEHMRSALERYEQLLSDGSGRHELYAGVVHAFDDLYSKMPAEAEKELIERIKKTPGYRMVKEAQKGN